MWLMESARLWRSAPATLEGLEVNPKAKDLIRRRRRRLGRPRRPQRPLRLNRTLICRGGLYRLGTIWGRERVVKANSLAKSEHHGSLRTDERRSAAHT